MLDLAEDVAPEKISRVKDKVKKSMNPMGHSFDALAKYKATTDKLDKFLIYKAQNGGLNGGPSYVFKTSEAQLQMALDMDRDAEGILRHEVCFADIWKSQALSWVHYSNPVGKNKFMTVFYIYINCKHTIIKVKKCLPPPLED